MKLTIIPADKTVTIDGVGFGNINLSWIDLDIHAVQWYDTYGDVEIKIPETGHVIANRKISSLAPFQAAIDAWFVAKTEYEAAIAAAAAFTANRQPTTSGSQTL